MATEITHRCSPDSECFCFYDPECNPALASETFERERAAVQALLGVLNDIGGGNPWNYNVITEAAEDAWRSALAAYNRPIPTETQERTP